MSRRRATPPCLIATPDTTRAHDIGSNPHCVHARPVGRARTTSTPVSLGVVVGNSSSSTPLCLHPRKCVALTLTRVQSHPPSAVPSSSTSHRRGLWRAHVAAHNAPPMHAMATLLLPPLLHSRHPRRRRRVEASGQGAAGRAKAKAMAKGMAMAMAMARAMARGVEVRGERARVCGVAVSMAAFQAVDPGSTPGTRMSKCHLFPLLLSTPLLSPPLNPPSYPSTCLSAPPPFCLPTSPLVPLLIPPNPPSLPSAAPFCRVLPLGTQC